MSEEQLWIAEATFEQKGSFCDTKSGHEYENRDAFRTEVASQGALKNREEVIPIDAPADPDDSYGPDQRFNLFRTEQDSQGTYTPRKYKPGK